MSPEPCWSELVVVSAAFAGCFVSVVVGTGAEEERLRVAHVRNLPLFTAVINRVGKRNMMGESPRTRSRTKKQSDHHTKRVYTQSVLVFTEGPPACFTVSLLCLPSLSVFLTLNTHTRSLRSLPLFVTNFAFQFCLCFLVKKNTMADKLGDFVNRFGKSPPGVGLGLKLLIAAGGLGYAATQSIYTGTQFHLFSVSICLISCLFSGGWSSRHYLQSYRWHPAQRLLGRSSFSVSTRVHALRLKCC